ncbi:MAG: TonB-dependent receptor [Prevotella sp.]|nr:TonB-dependent receptor [Prevotella sp.]MCH4211331.1 TonB-dependent receptor [Prevotella sp.]MCH4240508.1 TonB-dependent receptor [Prevotella sp.]
MNRILFTLFVLMMCVCVLPMQAQKDSLCSHLLQGVEVTAAVPSALKSGSPVQVMSRHQMDRMGVTDVSDALKHFAGVQVQDYGGVGGLKTVNIRGLGAQHTGVNYDGVEVGDCQSGQVDLSRFTLDNVSWLYLTIGQQDDIFESARQYASAGTINIITDNDKPFDPNRPFSGAGMLRTGSYGLIQPSVLTSDWLASKLHLSSYFSYQYTDGNYRYHIMNGTYPIDEKRNNSRVNAWRGDMNLAWLITPKESLHVKVYGFDSKRGLPGGVIYDNTYSAEELTDKNVFIQALYENHFSDRFKMKSAAKWNYSWMRDFNVPASGPNEDRFRQNEVYLTSTGLYQFTKNISASLAEDYQYNYLSTTLRSCPYPTRNSFLTAAAVKYAADRMTATTSLLYTHIHEHVRTGNAASDLHRLSPAFSLSWQPFSEELRFRLSYKDIFRAPTLNDLYYLLIGNTNLKPEKTRQWNFGVTWARHISTWIDHIAFTVDTYYGLVTDKIVAVPTMFIWKMTNLGKVLSLGTDVTMNTHLKWTKGWTSDILLTYNYLHAVDKTTKGGATYDNQMAYTPKNAGSASVMLHSPWVDLTYNLLLTGTRYTMNYNGPENHMPSIIDHSVTLSRNFPMGKYRLRLQLDALNLGGKNYEVIRFYPMPGRNFRLSGTFEF